MAQTSALVAPVQPILHRVLCSNETLPNAPKYYETHQNISLGSNGVDRVRSLWKIQMRFSGTNFCINCTSSALLYRASCSNKTIQNASKHYETHQNMSLGPNGVDRVHSLRKILMRLCGKNFALTAPDQPVLHRVFCSNETLPNTPKHYEMQQYMSLGSNGVGRVHSLRKFPKRLHGTNLCINCTSSTCFATSFV